MLSYFRRQRPGWSSRTCRGIVTYPVAITGSLAFSRPTDTTVDDLPPTPDIADSSTARDVASRPWRVRMTALEAAGGFLVSIALTSVRNAKVTAAGDTCVDGFSDVSLPGDAALARRHGW